MTMRMREILTDAERIRAAVASIQLAAWGDARGALRFRASGHDTLAREYERGIEAYLSALFFLDETPDGESMDLNSLLGARAWADGDGVWSARTEGLRREGRI
ncbi:MAG: hypothetical protein Q8S13_05945 [Dehalococcoidia bacterium]|nr:hypothetical protein [Dehalococcoidia bacterium]